VLTVPTVLPADWVSVVITLIGSTERVPATAAAAIILRTMVMSPKPSFLTGSMTGR
jgi:hypothetical protein